MARPAKTDVVSSVHGQGSDESRDALHSHDDSGFADENEGLEPRVVRTRLNREFYELVALIARSTS